MRRHRHVRVPAGHSGHHPEQNGHRRHPGLRVSVFSHPGCVAEQNVGLGEGPQGAIAFLFISGTLAGPQCRVGGGMTLRLHGSTKNILLMFLTNLTWSFVALKSRLCSQSLITSFCGPE